VQQNVNQPDGDGADRAHGANVHAQHQSLAHQLWWIDDRLGAINADRADLMAALYRPRRRACVLSCFEGDG
jgi:hypothetical protein